MGSRLFKTQKIMVFYDLLWVLNNLLPVKNCVIAGFVIRVLVFMKFDFYNSILIHYVSGLFLVHSYVTWNISFVEVSVACIWQRQLLQHYLENVILEPTENP